MLSLFLVVEEVDSVQVVVVVVVVGVVGSHWWMQQLV